MTEIKNDTEFIEPKPSELATKIQHNMWISGYIPSYNKEFLKRNSIKRIVRCFEDNGEHRFSNIKYLVIPATDTVDYKISKHFEDAINFISEGVKYNEAILIHCHAGISRSATIVLVYLMCLGYPLIDAYKLLQYNRPFVRPNDGFTKQLIIWRYGHCHKSYREQILKKLNELMDTKYLPIKLPKICIR
jgi:protein-tyrosine phosphatase